MSEAKMTPEKSFIAIVPDPGNSGVKRDKSPKTATPLEPPSQEFQCIVCKLIRESPTEMHQHQSSHTAEELSLSIIGLQILYNIHNYSKKVTASKSESDNIVMNLTNDNNNQETLSPLLIFDSNQPVCPEVQKEPMCLKVPVPNSVLKTNNSHANNHDQGLKTLIHMNNRSPKNPQRTVLSTKRQMTMPVGHQKHRKEIPILPALSNINDIKIQFGTVKNFPENKTIQDGFVKIDVSQFIQNKILGRTLVPHGINYFADQTFSVKKEGAVASQNEPICLKLSSKNVSFNSSKVENQTEKLEGIFKKPDVILKKLDDLKEPEKTIKRPELTIEKIDTVFKKPKSVIKKPVVTLKKLSKYVKKPEEMKSKKKINILPKNQPTGHFNKNLHNICNDMQKVYLKKPRSKSPLRRSESPFEIILEPPLQKSEPDFVMLESILKKPVASVEIVEPPPKKLKPLPPLRKSEPSFEIILKPPLQKSEPDFEMLESILKKSEASVEIVESPPKQLKLVPPLGKSEPSFEIILEPPLQKSEPDFEMLESILKKPVASLEIVEPSPKTLESVPQVPFEEINNEAFLKKKSLRIIEVGDDAWYESVKNKLYLESELPTDITNIAMQDFPNQSSGVSHIASENFNYNDLSSEAFMNLDSYLMASEIQPQDGLNSTSEVFMGNNLTLQNSNDIPEFDYSNADLFFGNNQQLLSRVDANENTWDSDGNPIYTELLPVFYS